VQVTGRGPKDVAVSPNYQYVFVSSSASTLLAIIRPSDNTVVTELVVGTSPDGLAVHPNSQFTYVAIGGANQITKIDNGFVAVVKQIPFPGQEPTVVVVTPDGSKLYAASAIDSTVAVFDTATDTLITTVNVGASNHRGIDVTPDGKHVYVTNLNDGTVSVIDAEADTLLTVIPVGASPRQLSMGNRAEGGDPTSAESTELPDYGFALDGPTVSFKVEDPSPVAVEVYDLHGRVVRTLTEGRLPSGEQSVVWDGTDQLGSKVAAGTYIIRMTSERGSQSKLVTRVR
jgi:YVTN family beta-propeller protein